MQHPYTKDELSALVTKFNDLSIEYTALNSDSDSGIVTMCQSKGGNWIFELDGGAPPPNFCLKQEIEALQFDIKNAKRYKKSLLRLEKIKQKVKCILTPAEFKLLENMLN